jgi:abortive infection bacteriophage resistance protein
VTVTDEAAAQEFLSHVNYYRLSGYCLAFENGGRHTFAPGTTFADIQFAYNFDFALRDLLSEALEVVEVDVRTAVAYRFGKQYGAFGHATPANFFQPPIRLPGAPRPPEEFVHNDWFNGLCSEVGRSKELFVEHFKATYSDYPKLPVWIATEVMSFGTLSKMCRGMLGSDQRAVAARYSVQRGILLSWAHHLTVVRNHCAHHARVWDRLWSVKPVLPAGNSWRPPYLPHNQRLSVTLLILNQLLKKCPSANQFAIEWRDRVNKLLAQPPKAPSVMDKMGLTPEWASGPLWQ